MSNAYEPRYSEPPKKSGTGKVLMLLGCGCLGIFLVCVGCCGVGPYMYFDWIKSSQPYKDSLAKVQAHPDVKQELGEPMEPGFWVGGTIDETQGIAAVVYQLKGPNGEAIVAGDARKAAGENEWKFNKLEVQIQKPGAPPKTIDVIKKEKEADDKVKDKPKDKDKLKVKDKPKVTDKENGKK